MGRVPTGENVEGLRVGLEEVEGYWRCEVIKGQK